MAERHVHHHNAPNAPTSDQSILGIVIVLIAAALLIFFAVYFVRGTNTTVPDTDNGVDIQGTIRTEPENDVTQPPTTGTTPGTVTP